ncbi:MAG: metalloregulator ArsR/SmtB family transcription factor [Oscillospiraceae bacterium]|nr:metalloregulator ArsR/SmtB family transcription factor [Oscillospiraceae bacterium]
MADKDISVKRNMHNHDALLLKIRTELPQDETLFNLADLFKVFGDTTRIKILYALFESELCVCAISELLGMTQSAISHQLRVLKDSKLVSSRREGKTIYYFLADDHVRSIIDQGYEHITEGSDK